MRLPAVRRAGPQSGIAILTVLLVLMALLALSAPFLMTTRNAAKASSQLADAAHARLALDSAARLARGELARSHPSVDPTPWSDSEDEIGAWTELDDAVLDAHDPLGVMWDASALDLAAQIDLASAPPQLFANVIGASTRLDAPLDESSTEIAVASTSGFRDQGFLWIGRELVAYGEREPQAFKKLERGLGAVAGEGGAASCGPQPAGPAAPGTPVIDQRAWAPVLWRLESASGEPRVFEAPEQLGDAARKALGGLDAPALQALQEVGGVHADLRSGPRWQRGARVLNAIQGGLDCNLVLDDARWFNPGTTVQITDGRTTELAVVQEVSAGGVRLMLPLANDYLALSAVARPQVRVPVNANTASAAVLEDLFANLQLARVNSRITRDEARALAALVIESRPFEGFEDFLRRVVLPAGGIEPLPQDAPVRPAALQGTEVAALCSEQDAFALYVNALNANDSRLAYSTLPLCFTTRDTYALDLRAAVNAKSGAERASARREQLELTVPQEDPLLAVWARQEDLDEALRLTREAPLWATGPSATSPGDDGTSPPSRARAHFGSRADLVFDPARKLPQSTTEGPGTDEHVFASREDTAWAQLAPAREDETGRRAGRALHFDHESQDLEGRFLPEGSETRPTTDPMIAWTPKADDYLRALDLSLWFEPRALGAGNLLDVGGGSLETDRVQLVLEGADLVLRVFDAGGDHPESALIEAGEARYAIQPTGTTGGAGLEPDTWTHVSIDVAGTRPDQITMLVDGQAHGVRTLGRTRLAAGLPPGAGAFMVEDGEGFPDRCVVRIGNELIECLRSGANVFDCTRQTAGENAGFGGRMARLDYFLTPTGGSEPGMPGVLAAASPNYTTNHPTGTPVQLYGYSLPIDGPVTVARSTLTSSVGVFAVGRIESVVGGAQTLGDVIEVTTTTSQGVPTTVAVGYGMAGAGSQVTGLVLQPVDPGLPQQRVLDAFSPTGGYALIVQHRVATVYGPAGGSGSGQTSITGDPIAGMEVVRYSGHDGTTLFIDQSARAALPSEPGLPQVAHGFVSQWELVLVPQGTPIEGMLNWEAFVMPISLSVPGASGFPPPINGSEYAQITHVTDAELTEWVRYDTSLGNELVRSDLNAFAEVDVELTGGGAGDLGNQFPPPPGGPGPDGGGSGIASAIAATVAPAVAAAAQSQSAVDWSPFMQDGGSAEDEAWPVTYAARTALQFRGVAGTYPVEHPAGTIVLPTFRVSRMPGEGMPGRHDLIFLYSDQEMSLGMPAHVHRAYRPNEIRRRGFTGNGQNPELPVAGAPYVEPEDQWLSDATWVALQDGAPIATAPGSSVANSSPWETRVMARISMHPSGERPREVLTAVVGGTIRGGSVPPCTVDEVVFGSTVVGDNTAEGPAIQGGQFVLDSDLPIGGASLQVEPQSFRVARGVYGGAGVVLGQLPQDAGLLRIGSEIVCYSALSAGTGSITIAPGGRALLGTVEEHHEAGEVATFLDGWTVSVLAAGAGADDASLSLADGEDFPPLGWLVRMGDELAHYTYLDGAALEMPRFSSEPGKMDRRGGGVFRGRFGTAPQAHTAGTPVILHPLRYSDRWADRADAPELAYFGFALDQPAAFVRSVFFDYEQPSSGSVSLNVLQRLMVHGELAAPPWDGDPALKESGLALFSEGRLESEGQPVAAQADRVEWRAFARYAPGAFDFATGASHGWKQTPRLRLMGAQYIAPGLVVRRVEK